MEILLVGNSKSLLDEEYGDFIDSHPYIVRFNNYETKGYEKNVGTKTDGWAMRACSDIKLAGKKEGVGAAFTFITYCKYLSGMREVATIQRAALGRKLTIVDEMSCFKYAKEMGFKNDFTEHPSIGALAISYFTELGYTIKLIGFSFDQSHYYKKQPIDGHYHAWEKEAAYVRSLKNVRFADPEREYYEQALAILPPREATDKLVNNKEPL